MKKVIKEIRKKFPSVDTKEKEALVASIYNIYKHHKVGISKEVLEYVIESDFKCGNLNDCYYLASEAYINTSGLKKIGYPIMQGALTEEYEEEFDIAKWIKLVHKIYDAVVKGEMSYDNAVDYYAGFLAIEKKEDENFKQWLKYYKNGEHLKYNRAAKERDMDKKSNFQFPLTGGGFYPPENIPMRPKRQRKDERKEEFKEWKNKLYIAIRRLDKLLRQGDPHMDSNIHAELADLLHAFDMEVRKVRVASTASDITLRASNAFSNKGFKKGAAVLKKFAQEAPIEPPIAPEPEDVLGVEPEPKREEGGVSAPLGKALMGGSGAKPGEYEELEGDVSLQMASNKLEEIAGKLADRRVVRLLAEFDIMLDKLGIAPMFPELAEAQSKLIDSYSYALTRVTKMLGMLSSGKNIAEIANAKSDELQRSVEKDVGKTFSPPEEKLPKEEVISEEFTEAPERAEAPEVQPEASPAAPPRM